MLEFKHRFKGLIDLCWGLRGYGCVFSNQHMLGSKGTIKGLCFLIDLCWGLSDYGCVFSNQPVLGSKGLRVCVILLGRVGVYLLSYQPMWRVGGWRV